MGAVSLRLPDDLERKLAAEAKLAGRPRSEVIRDALTQFIAQRERERFMAELVAEAKAGYSDPELRREALEMAEEAVALGNEALDLAEGRQPGQPWPEELGEKWWK
jgi:predicted transcriptional regulator